MTATSPTLHETRQPAKSRPSAGARRFGYLVAAAINVGIIWLLNVTPGWRWLPFLTEDFTAVLPLVNVSLVAGFLANLVYAVADPIWLRRLGDAITAAIATAVMILTATIFPFDFSGRWSWAETPVRVLLVLGIVGTIVAVVVNLVQAFRAAPGARH